MKFNKFENDLRKCAFLFYDHNFIIIVIKRIEIPFKQSAN